MNRSIKVSDDVYAGLGKLQRPRETYSDVVTRLLGLYTLLAKADPMIHSADDLQRWEAMHAAEKAPAV